MPRLDDLARQHANGLVTDAQRRIDVMLHDYNEKLSLRRIPTSDPAFTPGQPYGVHEEGVARGQTPWVFTLSEYSIDTRILARIWENDFARAGAQEQWTQMELLAAAEEYAKHQLAEEEQEAKREEMLAIATNQKTSFRHKFNGETMIVSDDPEPRSPRTYV